MKNCALILVAAAAISGIVVSQAVAGDLCCDHCGCRSRCRVVCRLVCEPEVITDHCYDCVCEDFCIPGPSKRCDCNCQCVHIPGPAGPPPCGCNTCRDNGTACKLKWYHWIPGCAKVHRRKVLIKYEVVKEVPSYHWVVECVCDDCGFTKHLETRPTAPPAPAEAGIVPMSAQMPVQPITYAPQQAQPPERSLLDKLLGK